MINMKPEKRYFLLLVFYGFVFSMISGCDTFVARSNLTGKWKAIDGSTIEFNSDKTITYTDKGKIYNIPGKWRILENGRVVSEIIDSDGLKEVDICRFTKDKLNGYCLVMDIDGITKVFIKIE